MPAEPVHRYVVAPADAEQRLQHFLAKRLALSLAQTNRLLDLGAVQVDHWIAKRKHKGYKLRWGQKIVVTLTDRPGEERAVAPDDAAVEIIAGDAERGWVIVNKPAGMPVHPLEPGETSTVLNALIARFPQVHGVGEGGLRSGVVHRLDIETSGALLFALTLDHWQRFRAAFTEHRTRKVYHALLFGKPPREGRLELPLYIAQHKPARVRVVEAEVPKEHWPAGTRLCNLSWRVLEVFDGASLVEVELGTGFLHQIRVMFAHLGNPVIGDAIYGDGSDAPPRGSSRLMLHASSLQVEEAEATCPDPADFAAMLSGLRERSPEPG